MSVEKDKPLLVFTGKLGYLGKGFWVQQDSTSVHNEWRRRRRRNRVFSLFLFWCAYSSLHAVRDISRKGPFSLLPPPPPPPLLPFQPPLPLSLLPSSPPYFGVIAPPAGMAGCQTPLLSFSPHKKPSFLPNACTPWHVTTASYLRTHAVLVEASHTIQANAYRIRISLYGTVEYSR